MFQVPAVMRGCIRTIAPAAFVIVLLAGAAPAAAITIDPSGKINGWDITPFSAPNGNSVVDGITSVRQNNYSPLNFPGSGHIPSPGGATGEKFDLEEVHVRNDGSQVQLLLIASSLFQASASGSNLKLGDLMINIDGDSEFELGVVTQSANTGLDAGRLYEIQSTAGLQNLPGSFAGSAIADEIGAWAVLTGVGQDMFGIETAGFNYGGAEGTAYAYQYTFDLGYLPSLPSFFEWQIAWGCGNDMIAGSHQMTSSPLTPGIAAVPEPTPIVLTMIGIWVTLAVVSRARRPSRLI